MLPVASSLLRPDELESVLGEYAPTFDSVGASLLSSRALPPEGLALFFVVTGGTERRILELVDDWRASRGSDSPRRSIRPDGAATGPRGTDGPVLLVAYPGRNSLPAALEVLARLQQDGVPGRVVFLDGPGDEVGIEHLRAALDASAPDSAGVALPRPRTEGAVAPGALRLLEPACRLEGCRIGLVGPPSDWLVASSPSPETVRSEWGVEVVDIGMGELRERATAAVGHGANDDQAHGASSGGRRTEMASDFAESFRSRASSVREPRDADLRASGAIYAALRSFVDEFSLDAVTVRCFDLVTEQGATGCLALSRLADEGVVAGCEGDIVSALGMLWVRERLGQVSWMANAARVDSASNTLWLAHCTVPGCMVSSYALRSHFESGLGTAVEGTIPTGLVTLLRIGGKGLDRLWVAEGEVVSGGHDEVMCRTQVEVRLCGAGHGGEDPHRAPRGSVADLLERPLGNHLVLTRGWVADDLLAP